MKTLQHLPLSTESLPKNDVIHVTLETASMKQLIKLSQDLIPVD